MHRGVFKVSHHEGRRYRRPRDSVVRGHRWWSSDEWCWPCTLLCRNIPGLCWRRPIGGCLWFKNAEFDVIHDQGDSISMQFQWVKLSIILQEFLKRALQAPDDNRWHTLYRGEILHTDGVEMTSFYTYRNGSQSSTFVSLFSSFPLMISPRERLHNLQGRKLGWKGGM